MSPSCVSVYRLVCCGVASLAATACGRPQEAVETSSNTVLTSAKVEVTTPDTRTSDEALCLTSSDEPLPVTSGTFSVPMIVLTALPPAKRPLHRRAVATKIAAPGALDKAIAGEVAAAGDRPVAPEADPIAAIADVVPAPSAEVTTTSATVPRAQPVAYASSRIAFENRLSPDYKVERLRVLVDGALSYDAATPGNIDLAPGPHVVEVIADYRLHDPLFTYVDDYRLELRSTEVVPASPVATAFVATARPAGGVTTPMNKRAALAWRSFPAR